MSDKLKTAILQQLRSLKAAGVQQVPLQTIAGSGAVRPPYPDTKVMIEQESEKSAPSEAGKSNAPTGGADVAADLQLICHEVAKCTLCTELAQTRNKTVFGVGNPQARLCFLGEAPGADEDRLGEPFVGRAGQLLDKILAACTLSRQDVYILNILKCRPPGNRNPLPEEVDNCRDFFERQIRLINPEYICCLGAVAATNLLDTKLSIGKLRGKLHEWNGIKVLATYHPAYLLRNPPAKKEVWKDMQFLMSEMGIQLPSK